MRLPRRRGASATDVPAVLILTPIKDAVSCLGSYCSLLESLTYPHKRISIGWLESDSVDGTLEAAGAMIPRLQREFRSAGLISRNFGYRVPAGVHRGHMSVQRERRTILARSRNYLLSRALNDEDWVLWIDVDVIDYPPDIIERMLATGKDIVHPHCVFEPGGRTFDENAWRDQGRVGMKDLRGGADLAELHAVGGTMLLVRADAHREGLIFPPVPYGGGGPLARPGRGEIETEGLGIMAVDMGYQPWGMPNLEIVHRNW